MTTDENILKEMLERVTNPKSENVDNLAVQMFCLLVKGNQDLITKAHQLIVSKMQSKNITEAARAIGLLEECMSKAGTEFQKKTAKFSFLNELIALVLHKHPGPSVPSETKKRIMECLMLWTVEHQDKSKIQEAYDSLKNQVNFEHGNVTNSTSPSLLNSRTQRSNILGKDDQLVATLLKQGGAENLKKANLLIQHRVNQESRRVEFFCHLKSELKKVESTMELFDEMLNCYNPENFEADSRDIIVELNSTCKGHYEQMSRWPDFLGDTEPEFLEDILNTKEILMVSLQRYKDIIENKDQYAEPANLNTSITNTDLLTELLGDTSIISSQVSNQTQPQNTTNANKSVDELNEIFGGFSDNIQTTKSKNPSYLLSNLSVLEPINVFNDAINDKPATSATSTRDTNEEKLNTFKELTEIDKLSEEIFKRNLKEEQRLHSFKKGTEKTTLNDMAKDKKETLVIADKEPRSVKETVLTSNEENKKTKTLDSLTIDFENLIENKEKSLKETDIHEKELKLNNSVQEKIISKSSELLTLKPLAEISIDIDEITPLDEGQRLLLDDEDIQVSLHFTADRPSQYVSVIVMTVTNKSKLPVKEFQFEASVKKPCKVRLLPPTDVAMAPRKPFRPSTPINQVLLLLNPTQKPVDITCIIGYKLGDDPDPYKDSILTKDIPFV